MVFKKPYAFFIKYFRVINLLLSILFIYLGYKLSSLRGIVNKIYLGKITDFTTLKISFDFYLVIFLIASLLIIILLLLYRKKKPFYDYLYALIYLAFVFVYLMAISNLFFVLNNDIVEITKLKTYTDISFLIMVPMLYFITKYIMIVIGFSLQKFNFTKDIIELKQEEKDNEEVELIFDKNTYRYKRNIRKQIREFKYYYLENRFLILTILSIVIVVTFISLFSLNKIKSNKVSINSTFNAGDFSYKINNVYETDVDLNSKNIDSDNKFVIASINVKDINVESKEIDLKRIRLVYNNNDYSYATSFYNKYFYDIGKPYNNDVLKSNELYNYIFIFKVPKTYKSRNYILKFYDRVIYENDDIKGTYKEVEVTAKKINNKRSVKEVKLNENVLFNKKSYGNSNLTISEYEIKSNYIYDNNGVSSIIRSKDVNKVLLILDYTLALDSNYPISSYFSDDKYFFNNFISVSYNIENHEKEYNNINVVGSVNNMIMLEVPFEMLNAKDIYLNIEFRDTEIKYNLSSN